MTDRNKCYHINRFTDEVLFTYCKNCKFAKQGTHDEYFVPTITLDLNDNKQCISFVPDTNNIIQ